MEWNRCGIMREVFLTRRYAIKLPRLSYGWKIFLHGLLANMQEARWGKCGLEELCPVIFAVPGGWLLIMRKAEPLTIEEWDAFKVDSFCEREDYTIPAERKHDSFGRLNGKIVAVDYGS